MAVSPEYKAFVEELFDVVFPVRVRAMFGGAGIYASEVMFGLIAGERIYLKVDDVTRADFAAEGSGPFVWVTEEGVEVPFTYYELPDRLYDEPGELKAWAMKALDVALRAKKKPGRPTAKSGAKRAKTTKPKPRALTNRTRPKAKPRKRKAIK